MAKQDCLCMEVECCCTGCKLKALAVLIFLGIVVYGLSKIQGNCQEIQTDQDMRKVMFEKVSLFNELQKLKEEYQNLAEKLRNAEAALQMERANKKNPGEASSALLVPHIYSVLLGLCVTIFLLL